MYTQIEKSINFVSFVASDLQSDAFYYIVASDLQSDAF